jgi:hypothetical protein
MQTHLKQKIKSTTKNDEIYKKLHQKLDNNKSLEEESKLRCNHDDLVHHKDRIYVPNNTYLNNLILAQVHKKPYSGHLGYQKNITTLKKRVFLARNEN